MVYIIYNKNKVKIFELESEAKNSLINQEQDYTEMTDNIFMDEYEEDVNFVYKKYNESSEFLYFLLYNVGQDAIYTDNDKIYKSIHIFSNEKEAIQKAWNVYINDITLYDEINEDEKNDVYTEKQFKKELKDDYNLSSEINIFMCFSIVKVIVPGEGIFFEKKNSIASHYSCDTLIAMPTIEELDGNSDLIKVENILIMRKKISYTNHPWKDLPSFNMINTRRLLSEIEFYYEEMEKLKLGSKIYNSCRKRTPDNDNTLYLFLEYYPTKTTDKDNKNITKAIRKMHEKFVHGNLIRDNIRLDENGNIKFINLETMFDLNDYRIAIKCVRTKTEDDNIEQKILERKGRFLFVQYITSKYNIFDVDLYIEYENKLYKNVECLNFKLYII